MDGNPGSMSDIDTHKLVVDFGRHKGELWTRMPVPYLKWLINESSKYAPIAQAELKRRGIALTQDLDVSGHAIDRASQVLIGKWMETRLIEEGLHGWLLRMATAARKDGKKVDAKYLYAGMKFVFAEGDIWPTLTTVMLDRSKT
jgi:hypothetical protein